MRLRSLSAPWFRTALLACGLSLLAAAPTQAQTMTQNFDGLPCIDNNPYFTLSNQGGLTWSNFLCMKSDTYAPNPSGYVPGTTSGTHVGFTGADSVATISRSTGVFSLQSAQITSAWRDDMTLTIRGFLGTTPVASLTLTPSSTAPTLVNLSAFIKVDRVTFERNGGTQHPGYSASGNNIAIDDLTYVLNPLHAITVAPAPVNGTLSCTPNPVLDGTNATCTATPAPFYQVSNFSGCTRVGTTNDCQLTNVTAPATVSATFTLATYTITAANDPNGTLTCTPNPVTHGGNVTCTATPAAGYLLSGFTGCTQVGTGNTCTLSNVTGPATVAAVFTVAIPTLSQWALMLLGLGAAGLGARRLRRAA